ncbi:hypothetical protein [Streptomyces sp. NPDC047141]|uniref:hypothetical protein n=1 Tax=Streptomyces sp. NPDC047141 TaxID=3155738 RepID=UPI0033F75E1C
MRALRTPLTTAAVLALASLLATGCTTAAPAPPPPPSATGNPTNTRPDDEREQGERAQAAVSTTSPDDPEFVESGLERVGDGVHARSPLTRGKGYRLSVACVGTGHVKLAVADGTPRTVACDGVPTTQRIEHAPTRLPIDITETPGSTGMVAWQLASVPT